MYLGKGNPSKLVAHHAVIIPDHILTSAPMNNTNSTDGGYVNSTMYTETLNTVYTDYIEPVFSNHVLDYNNLLTNKINASGYNRFGRDTGCSSGWEWKTRKLDLMNEVDVYGSIAFSSSGYDIGSDNTQLPLFRLAPQYMRIDGEWYYLRAICNTISYACIYSSGHAYGNNADIPGGIRPKFYIGKSPDN